MQALEAHSAAAAHADDAATAREAREAALVALQCLRALTSGAGGMEAALAAPGLLQRVAAALGSNIRVPARVHDPGMVGAAAAPSGAGAADRRAEGGFDADAARVVSEMLTNMCLFSADGYHAALQVPLHACACFHQPRFSKHTCVACSCPWCKVSR